MPCPEQTGESCFVFVQTGRYNMEFSKYGGGGGGGGGESYSLKKQYSYVQFQRN